jgi:hypothetical protein
VRSPKVGAPGDLLAPAPFEELCGNADGDIMGIVIDSFLSRGIQGAHSQLDPMNFRTFMLVAVLAPLAAATSVAADNSSATFVQKPGRLGLALGTEARIVVEIVRAEDVKMPALAGGYLLKVLRVNDRDLTETPIFQYKAEKALARKLPNDSFGLHRMKTGKDVDELTMEQLKTAEDGYVGRKLTLMASETEAAPLMGDRKTKKVPTLILSQCLEDL